MEELELKDVLKIIKKRKGVLVSLVLVPLFLAVLYCVKTAPVYQAKTKILIELKGPQPINIEDILAQDSQTTEFLNTQFELLRSRSLAREVIQKLELENKEELNQSSFPFLEPVKEWVRSLLSSLRSEGSPDREKIPTDPYTPLVDKFLKRLKISPVEKSKVVDVQFEGYSPVLITRITNTLAETYIVRNLELQSLMESDAKNWLRSRTEEMEKEIRQLEQALQNYKEQKTFIDAQGKRDFVAEKLNELIREHAQARSERLRLEILLNKLEGLRSRERDPVKIFLSISVLANNEIFFKLKEDYHDLKGQLDSLLQTKTPQHPDYISLSQKMEALEKRIANELEDYFQSSKMNYESALARENSLASSLENQRRKVIGLDKDAIQFNVLKEKLDSHKKLYEVLSSRLKQLDLSSQYNETNIRIIDRAEVPFRPIKPRTKMVLALSGSLGLFGGILIIFFMESLDKSIKSPEDVERSFPFPFLGSIGTLSWRKSRNPVVGNDPHRTEEFRALGIKLISSVQARPRKVFLITSATEKEGKSTVASNLAVVLGKMGKKVALLDADLKNPTLHEIFKTPDFPGVIEGLTGTGNPGSIFHKTQFDRVWVVPSRKTDPGESLSPDVLLSERLPSLLTKIRGDFDFILVKSPPILSAPEVSLIEKSCEGILFVIESKRLERETIERALESLFLSRPEMISRDVSEMPEAPSESLPVPSGESIKRVGMVLTKVKF